MRKKVLAVCCLQAVSAWAEEPARLEEVSVTATREARTTGEVPQAIAVVGEETIADKKMFNVKEALQGIPGVLIDSKNGGSDSRLIIRGAGLKAPYGIREIMVLRDGVPVTDPDSFTKLDFIDTQDIERIEVAKGPGNLFATGSAGGAIQIFSRSVFDDTADRLRLGLGTEGTENAHLRLGTVGERQALALTASHRAMDNDWRAWNRTDTQQLSLKHGAMLDRGTWESEVSYAASDTQLPGSMSLAQFEQFKRTGEQTATQDAWKHSGRYSKTWFFNTKYEVEQGDLTFKPRFYYTRWTHYHPVTGLINETEDWVQTLGTDLEAQLRHSVGGAPATLVGGVTLRRDSAPDSRKYLYRDYTLDARGRISATLSDAKGALAQIGDSDNRLAGLFAQESWRPSERWIVDAGVRYDVLRMDIREDERWKYDYATGKYVDVADNVTQTEKTFRLFAPKLAATYKLNPVLSLYAMVAEAAQVPSESEVTSNPDLNAAKSRNYEVGLKGRHARFSFDASVYYNPVKDEIVTVRQPDGETQYVNAGETDKRGLELSGGWNLSEAWEIGAHYAYSDYTFERFSEPVYDPVTRRTTNEVRDGNRLPYIPRHQYGVYAAWKHPSGWRARLASNYWGKYWMDNANTETYEGTGWVTNLTVAYEKGAHTFGLIADNVTDRLYAMEAKKDTSRKVSYTAAAPRTLMLTYGYRF